MNPSKSYVVNGVRYCQDCGNFDCPNASSDPYWRECPATYRTENKDAGKIEPKEA